jgi:A/G-specific adenine glycosylase
MVSPRYKLTCDIFIVIFYLRCHLLLLLDYPTIAALCLFCNSSDQKLSRVPAFSSLVLFGSYHSNRCEAALRSGGVTVARYFSALKMGKRAKMSLGHNETPLSASIKKAKTTKATLEETEKATASLLQSWAAHSHASFHDFSPEDAKAIRRALLNWYRKHRRKLPWRGDVPPYNGSTAKSKTPATNAKHLKVEAQTDVRSFFLPKLNNGSSQQDDAEAASTAKTTETPGKKGSTTNVTAYGIWVSEIMLQQTRVEAVIPYYLKCKLGFYVMFTTERRELGHPSPRLFLKNSHRCSCLFLLVESVLCVGMERFPTVHALAAASEEDVNAHWAGLGFYRRARLLHQGAKTVVKKFNGIVPSTVEDLLSVDGIGR